MPRPEAGGAIAFLDGEIVVAGGTAWDGGVKSWLSDVQLYNPVRNEWRSGPPLPAPLAYGPFAQVGDRLEIFGGEGGNRVYRQSWTLDRNKAEWQPNGLVPADTLLAAAVAVDHAVFLFGGCPEVADLTGCSAAVRRRANDGEWTRVSTLPHGPLALAAISSAGGQIYLFGGCAMPAPGTVVNRAEAYRYDPRSGSWAGLRPLPAASRGMSAVAVDSRHIYLLGGYGETFRADVLIYDIQTDTYEQAEPLPAPLMAAPFVLAGRTMYGAGGEDRPRGRSSRLIAGDLAK